MLNFVTDALTQYLRQIS